MCSVRERSTSHLEQFCQFCCALNEMERLRVLVVMEGGGNRLWNKNQCISIAGSLWPFPQNNQTHSVWRTIQVDSPTYRHTALLFLRHTSVSVLFCFVVQDCVSQNHSYLKLSKLTECVKNVKDWMTNNFLLLNSDKTVILLLGPKNSTQNLLDHILQLDRCHVPSSTVKNLGVVSDSNLSF